MCEMNSVTLIGALTKDPEMKDGGDTKVCSLRVAEGSGRKEPLYINVSAFGRQAETCKEYLVKGRQVAVSGQLRFREWETDQGKRSEHSIAADRVDFLPGAKAARKPENGSGGGDSQDS
jgi:single-strand DNA-binding protein